MKYEETITNNSVPRLCLARDAEFRDCRSCDPPGFVVMMDRHCLAVGDPMLVVETAKDGDDVAACPESFGTDADKDANAESDFG